MKSRRIKRQGSALPLAILLIAVFATLMLVSKDYGSVQNVRNIFSQASPLIVVSLGQTAVVLAGGIDMSVGSTISMITCVLATIMKAEQGYSLPLALLVAIIAAIGVGLLNGIGVTKLRIPPMIMTLSTSILVSGIALSILPVAGGKIHRNFATVLTYRWWIFSAPVLVMALCLAALALFLHRTRTGIYIYAVGKNHQISASLGINNTRVIVTTYVISAISAAITGMLLAARMRVGDPLVGTTFSLDSITATAVGGTSLAGGSGLLTGTVLGGLLIGMLSNLMNILGVNHFYQYVLKGLLLIVAMIIYAVSDQIRIRRHA